MDHTVNKNKTKLWQIRKYPFCICLNTKEYRPNNASSVLELEHNRQLFFIRHRTTMSMPIDEAHPCIRLYAFGHELQHMKTVDPWAPISIQLCY